MRSSRRLAAVFAGCVLAAALAAPGGARDGVRVRPPALRGINVLTSDVTGGVEVRLPKPAGITAAVWGPRNWVSRDVAISSDADLGGLVLVEKGVASREATRLVALQGDWCTDGCRRPDRYYIDHSTGTRSDEAREMEVLPAGDYYLYVVAEGAPTSVTIRLRGLTGRLSLDLEQGATTTFEQEPVGTEVRAPLGFSTYWSGRSVGIHGESGFLLSVLRVKGGPWVRGRSGGCLYRDEPPPSPVAFAPRCPGGADTAVESGIVRTEFDSVGWYMAFVRPRGVWSFGHYYYALATVEDRRHVTFSMDVDPATLGAAREGRP